MPSSVKLFTLLARLCLERASTNSINDPLQLTAALATDCAPRALGGRQGRDPAECGFTSSSAQYSVYQVQGSTYTFSR